MPNGRPLVISGPSGVGKSTILKQLFAEFPKAFGFSVSHTTRSPRPGETNGVEYHFTTKEEFLKKVAEKEFIEHATFGGNMYGTSIAAVEQVSKDGKICLLDIDRQGVESVKKTNMNALFVYVKPPSLQVLMDRLRGRGTESEESFQKRMEAVGSDMEYAEQPGSYDLVVVNDNLERAYAELKAFLQKHYASLAQ